jgi:hypothetical protein
MSASFRKVNQRMLICAFVLVMGLTMAMGARSAHATSLNLWSLGETGSDDNTWAVYSYASGVYTLVTSAAHGSSNGGWSVTYSITSTNPNFADGAALTSAPSSANGSYVVRVFPGPSGLGSGNTFQTHVFTVSSGVITGS